MKKCILALGMLITASSAFSAPDVLSVINNKTKWGVCVVDTAGNATFADSDASTNFTLGNNANLSYAYESDPLSCNVNFPPQIYVRIGQHCFNRNVTIGNIVGGNVFHLSMNCH